ncbi:MAG: cytochrome c-type biogenesis protein [Longimicrobiales bacterium]
MYTVLLILTVLAQPQSVPTQTVSDSILEVRVSAIASTLRCPVCQGLSIEDSPDTLAREMRGVVRDQLKAGRTPQQVKAYFVAKYSEFVLLQPEPRGFNLMVYILPVVALLGGAVVIVSVARKWSRAGDRSLATVSELEEEVEHR